jgi:hypothetical protein
LRTICSGLCRFLVAMILLSLPAHNVGRKTLISRGSTDRGQATCLLNMFRCGSKPCTELSVTFCHLCVHPSDNRSGGRRAGQWRRNGDTGELSRLRRPVSVRRHHIRWRDQKSLLHRTPPRDK